MKFAFGPFELDEEARSLTLGGAAQFVQPRVFDLLAYLVKNAGRVVPKDELMDVLWPNVIVTESSLQRAASLARRALAAGGLGNALKNFARHGYRFGVDQPGLGILAPKHETADGAVTAAREAVDRRDWAAAAQHFASAAGALDADDLELWAFADECRGRPVEAIPALGRAIEMHLAAGRAGRGGRAAVTLAKIEFERGAAAAAEGWLARAETVLEGVNDPSFRAYLLWMKSRYATFSGQPKEALALGSDALDMAEASGDNGLRALALVYKGFYHLSLGEILEGARLQNHAAAIALSSNVDAMTGSLVYCNILWSCRTFADWERALQWSDGFEAWCDAAFTERTPACDLHRAEILGARGTLGEAFEKISSALPRLTEEESWSIGEGYRVRGDVSAMMGNLDAAAKDYATAYSIGWDAEPGNAVLLAEAGDFDAALKSLDRALFGRTWFHMQRRGVLLVNAARIAAWAGDAKRAKRYLSEVTSSQDRWPQPAIRAMVAETMAALLPPGDQKALQLMLLARQLWTSAKIDYHAARVRVELAKTYIAAGDAGGATAELAAAERTAQRIGSDRIARACAQTRQRAEAA